MIRKLMLLSAILVCLSAAVKAQYCGIDIARKQFLIEHPELAAKVAENERIMNEQIANFLKNKNTIRTSNAPTNLARIIPSQDSLGYDTFIIPVVVHIIHDYGQVPPYTVPNYFQFQEDLSDSVINVMIQNLNIYYNERNPDIVNVIAPFKQYVGKMRILFRLATLDPAGKPTRGITRRASYLTWGGDNNAKFDLWDPTSYLNIWTENIIGLGADIPGSVVAAYSQLPDVGAADPLIDGLITAAPYTASGGDAFIISHEVGHYLGLLHPFGNNNSGCASAGCGDDGVDDTPPTTGEFCVSCAVGLYDTMCATGYKKISSVDSIYYQFDSATHKLDTIITTVNRLVDYPDTANTQNIMTYSQCDPELMFTKGQVVRVQGVLQSSLAGRNHLSDTGNLRTTGATSPLPILPPVADFNINNHFVCMGSTSSETVTFTNFSWNDTIQSVQWTLPSYASTPSSTNKTSFTSSFSQPGWVTISLIANGKGTSGSDTLVRSDMLYVADTASINPNGYFEEFNPSVSGSDMAKYPFFNYFNNEFKWTINSNTGYYDNSCLQYVGFDNRTFPANSIGLPKGDWDDMFTPAFDLTSLSGGANTPTLNFMYASASLTPVPSDINDTLEIDYNTACSSTWTPLVYLTKGQLINNGASSIAFRPLWSGNWSLQSIPLVTATKNAISSHTMFRFRYRPGVNYGYYVHTASGYSTGNNFFMDRLNFSNFPQGLNTLMPDDKSVVVAPNPTNGDAFVMIANPNNVNATVEVTDIAGRVVYTTSQQTTGSLTRIAIPRSAINVAGMYLVHVVAGDQNTTAKLVSY